MPGSPTFPCVAIGYFRSDVQSKVEAPRQPGLVPDNVGRVEFAPEYQDAVADLAGFEFVWLIAWLDRAEGWRSSIQPPRARAKKSLFATRSPHRPNPIGISSVRLVSIDGSVMHVRGHDLIDGTPILDVKPYLPYTDAHPEARMGWVEETDDERYEVQWTDRARKQADWLRERGVDLAAAQGVLELRPQPAPSHRVRELSAAGEAVDCEFALRTWRIDFARNDRKRRVVITAVRTGYSREVLRGDEESRWDDVPLHREFGVRFP